MQTFYDPVGQTMTEWRRKKDKGLKTTQQSLGVLEFIEERGGATTREVRNEFDLPKSTAHNHLRTLHESGYLAKSGETYILGLKILGMGESARTRHETYSMAGEKVTELANSTNEGADFCVLEHNSVYAVFNEVVNPNDPHFRMGKQFYIHVSAAGKAILAAYSESKADRIIDEIEMVRITENTITSKDQFREELQEVKSRGYAYTDEEYSEGLRAVAAPILLPDGRPLGALSVGGPSYRFNGEYYREEIPSVLMKNISELEDSIISLYTL